jgi:hypothetical protein
MAVRLFGVVRFSGLVRPETNPLRAIRWDNLSPANANKQVGRYSRDPPPVISLRKRRLCLGMTSDSFSIQNGGSGVLSVRTRGSTRETEARFRLSASQVFLWLDYSNYPMSLLSSKVFLMKIIRAISVPVRIGLFGPI